MDDNKKKSMNKENIDEARFGHDIKAARESKGHTQQECAKEFQKYIRAYYGKDIRVPQSLWTLYESGARIPNLDRFYELCSFFNLSPKDYMIDLSLFNEDMGAFDKRAFREALADTRREYKLTIKMASEKADIPIAVYERIEKSGVANIHNFVQICTAFALDPDVFLHKQGRALTELDAII